MPPNPASQRYDIIERNVVPSKVTIPGTISLHGIQKMLSITFSHGAPRCLNLHNLGTLAPSRASGDDGLVIWKGANPVMSNLEGKSLTISLKEVLYFKERI